jgi:hypothetical protein
MIHNQVYCDVVAGELICFFERDNLIANQLISKITQSEGRYIQIIGTMVEKLHALGLQQVDYFRYELYLFRVEEGSEVMKINWLFEEYNKLIVRASSTLPTDFIEKNHFYVVPNSYYSLNSLDVSKSILPEFEFTAAHQHYKDMMGFDKMQHITNKYKGVLIIDSGVQVDEHLNIVSQVDFLSGHKKEQENEGNIVKLEDLSKEAIDNNGHGTAIAKIINDICPNTPLTVFKIANQAGVCTEWDLAAALIAKSDTQIINLSLSYGLPSTGCNACGRVSSSVRSSVLEFAISYLQGSGEKIIVASGGNNNLKKLSFPARYHDVVGVVGMKQNYEKSSFSNFGNLNAWGEPHSSVITAFGGECNEPIFHTANNKINGWGTSFANCYVVALLNYIWSRFDYNIPHAHLCVRESMIHWYTQKSFVGYDEKIFGKGLICIGEESDNFFDNYWNIFLNSINQVSEDV